MKLPRWLAALMPTDLTPYPRMPQLASSGDLVLDRRREWALAATREGFHQGAADIYEQILERAPFWAVAWFELGMAREKLGDRSGAISAFEAAAARDGQGLLAADLKLAALGAREPPANLAASYVTGLFDQYADTFDTHLVTALEYRGPELLRDAIERACKLTGQAIRFDIAYDLGCGTGLMGQRLRDICGSLTGVDLSPRMVEAARRTGFYDDLETGALLEFLRSRPRAAANLAVAADVLVYVGDLADVFAAAGEALAAGGLFAFSVQTGDGEGYSAGSDMRYAHSGAYLRAQAKRHGFAVTLLEEASTRKDGGAAVPGLIAAFSKF